MEVWQYRQECLYPKWRWNPANCLPDTVYDEYNDAIAYWMHRSHYERLVGPTTEDWILVSKEDMLQIIIQPQEPAQYPEWRSSAHRVPPPPPPPVIGKAAAILLTGASLAHTANAQGDMQMCDSPFPSPNWFIIYSLIWMLMAVISIYCAGCFARYYFSKKLTKWSPDYKILVPIVIELPGRHWPRCWACKRPMGPTNRHFCEYCNRTTQCPCYCDIDDIPESD